MVGDNFCESCYYQARERGRRVHTPTGSVQAGLPAGRAGQGSNVSFVTDRAITMARCYGRTHRTARLKKVTARLGLQAMVKVGDLV